MGFYENCVVHLNKPTDLSADIDTWVVLFKISGFRLAEMNKNVWHQTWLWLNFEWLWASLLKRRTRRVHRRWCQKRCFALQVPWRPIWGSGSWGPWGICWRGSAWTKAGTPRYVVVFFHHWLNVNQTLTDPKKRTDRIQKSKIISHQLMCILIVDCWRTILPEEFVWS